MTPGTDSYGQEEDVDCMELAEDAGGPAALAAIPGAPDAALKQQAVSIWVGNIDFLLRAFVIPNASLFPLQNAAQELSHSVYARICRCDFDSDGSIFDCCKFDGGVEDKRNVKQC